MKRPSAVSVVIPCLDEAATLPRVLQRLRVLKGRRFEVLVVDNGSADGSARVARQGGARVLAWAERGYGAAVRQGLAAAKHPLILCLDADDSCDAAAIPELLRRLDAGADLAIGSRRLGHRPPGHTAWLHHRLGTPVLTWACNALYGRAHGPRLTDVTSGFFAFRRDHLASLDLQSRGFDLNVELFGQALRQAWRVEEVAVAQLPSWPGRRPHLRTWPDGCRLLWRVLSGALA